MHTLNWFKSTSIWLLFMEYLSISWSFVSNLDFESTIICSVSCSISFRFVSSFFSSRFCQPLRWTFDRISIILPIDVTRSRLTWRYFQLREQSNWQTRIVYFIFKLSIVVKKLVEIFINTNSTETCCSYELFDRWMCPTTKRNKITERWIIIIMWIP